jgi:hypothetical protein
MTTTPHFLIPENICPTGDMCCPVAHQKGGTGDPPGGECRGAAYYNVNEQYWVRHFGLPTLRGAGRRRLWGFHTTGSGGKRITFFDRLLIFGRLKSK